MNVKNLIRVASSAGRAHDFAILGQDNENGRVHPPSAERRKDAEAIANVLTDNLPLETLAFLALDLSRRYAASPEMREAMARASTNKLLPWEAREVSP